MQFLEPQALQPKNNQINHIFVAIRITVMIRNFESHILRILLAIPIFEESIVLHTHCVSKKYPQHFRL